jgi:methylthioribose-1-phosphate isomerase
VTITAIRYTPGRLELLDQRLLPEREVWLSIDTAAGAADAIRDMVVRGAPAIAITAAYGMALGVTSGEDRSASRARLLEARPTAVNLRWALERLDGVPDEGLEAEARAIHAEDLAINRALGEVGADHIPPGGVYTHCNTGALATGGWGTALGVIRSMMARGLRPKVYAGETRPYLQGARLTAWECWKDDIACRLVPDSAAGSLMAEGRVRSVIVGADRVAANGDTANKIGTYSLAVLARYHQIPFFVAMPLSTLDLRCPDGAHIPIEARPPDELIRFRGHVIAPPEIGVYNPAFDITPAALISGWITEEGLWTPADGVAKE